MNTLMAQTLELPSDKALPGLGSIAVPERMLEILRGRLADVPAGEREGWKTCTVREAVYQPGRACRISYALGGDDSEREDLVYARWDLAARPHASAVTMCIDGAEFEVYRYPRDRRMRQIRSMRRSDWLQKASEQWFRDWLGEGSFSPEGWRCSPIKYVPESRLVCRLKGRWIGKGEGCWLRAYIRIARRNDAQFQFDALRAISQSFVDCGADLTVPRALGYLPARHLLATEFIRGRALRETACDEGPDRVAGVCRQLAALARCNPKLPLSPAPPAGANAPGAMLADLALGHPLSRSLCDALAVWAAQSPPSPRQLGLVHGDLHGGQVMIKGGRVCVVDWERAALSDGTRDITNLAAEFAAARWLDDDATWSQQFDLAAVCVDSWRSAGGVWTAPSARWWATRALVLRAWGLLRHLRPGWPRTTTRLLDRAVHVFQAGADWLR